MLKGFKEFITRGNVIELAVGVIIGTAFKDIVDSLVNNVINPLIGMIFGKPDFSNMLIFSFNGSSLKFGVLLTAVINFLLISFALYFFLVLPMNALAKRTKKAQDAAPRRSPTRSSSSPRSATLSPGATAPDPCPLWG